MQLAWKPSLVTTGLHAAEGLSRGLTPADPAVASVLAGPAQRLQQAIAISGAAQARLWRHLLGLAAKIDGNRPLAEAALVKAVGRGERFDSVAAQLAAALAELTTVSRQVFPNFDDEMELRSRPLMEQWEARGPGLLRQIALLTEERLLAQAADVILVHPVFGGAGEAHLANNSVRIEAVLANPHAELPEVVRLGWLLAQVQIDLPVWSENVHADRLPHIARFATLPAALKAAEEVELARFTPELVSKAIFAWQLTSPPGFDAAAMVLDWWHTYEQSRPSFRVALEALDQMFG